jgi:hypothetical protein
MRLLAHPLTLALAMLALVVLARTWRVYRLW